MADLICRWRNGTPKNVAEVVNSMPHKEMPEWQFKGIMKRSIWGDSFSKTVYQFASQLALYYISEDGIYHPRFDHDISELEAKVYMEYWMPRYYVPNPYVSSDGFNTITCPTLFLKSLYDYVCEHPDCNYSEAYYACFHESAKNNDDIIRNYINNYSKVLILGKNGRLNKTNINPQNVFGNMDRNDKKAFFEYFSIKNFDNSSSIFKGNVDIISALRTKPFLLLAGISGTGKSRKVQELAYLTCKRDGIHDIDKTSPGNYLLIPVKPNWHDSTELLGYYSSISGKYMLTDFIRFVWKASIHKDVPYFLCLDEMNLAPVEQYFAEYLSILETRKLVYNEPKKTYEIQTAEILPKKQFEGLDAYAIIEDKNANGDDDIRTQRVPLYKGDDIQIINFLKENGLHLPENLFVIGTVNMDDTTHQFSRKVIDRAFTIEMNGGDLSKMFDPEDTLTYQEEPLTLNEIKPRFVKAQEVLKIYPDDANTIKNYVPELLDRINGEGIFKDTPFRVSYRVQNELVLYYASIRPQGDLTPEKIKPYLQEAFMAILLEKILPRVEGDEKAMKCNEKGDSKILLNIKQYLNEMKPIEGEPSPTFNTLIKKLDEMNERVKNSYFTSFFS
jgi:hypothetical protein